MRPFLPLLLCLVLAPLISANGALTGYLKIPDIPGESNRAKHVGEIDIQGLTWGVSRSVSGAGAGAISNDYLVVTKQVDKSTPKLIGAVAQALTIPEVVITLSKDSGEAHLDYLKITLTNVSVASYDIISDSSESVPLASVGFFFERIALVYTEYDESGVGVGEEEVTWNFALNTP